MSRAAVRLSLARWPGAARLTLPCHALDLMQSDEPEAGTRVALIGMVTTGESPRSTDPDARTGVGLIRAALAVLGRDKAIKFATDYLNVVCYVLCTAACPARAWHDRLTPLVARSSWRRRSKTPSRTLSRRRGSC
jgi:hypothetical protein